MNVGGSQKTLDIIKVDRNTNENKNQHLYLLLLLFPLEKQIKPASAIL